MLAQTWDDVRLAGRTLSRSPGFAVAAIVTIALGTGVNAGIFSVLNGVLFRDLPAAAAHELVAIGQTVVGVEGHQISGAGTFSTAEYRTYRDEARTLSAVAGYANAPRATLVGDAPREVFGTLVTCGFFDVLRQPPVLGRALVETDCAPGADPVLVLGQELWKAAFAADPEVLGRSVVLNRRSFTVVGVAAAGTYGGGPFQAAFFAPISAEPLLRSNRPRFANDAALWLKLIGRRGDGVGIAQVRAELGVIASRIDRLTPGRTTSLTVERATARTGSVSRLPGLGAAAVAMAAFGLILLIAGVNVANLLLARGTTRNQEIAIRLALGASRARIVRQLLTESVLLSILGGVLGSVLALWAFQFLVALAVPHLLPPELPLFAWDLSPDGRVLAFAGALMIGTGVLFGLAPAWHVSKPDLHTVIKQGATSGGGRRGGRLRGALIGAQVALCMTLMIAAGLLLRGLHATYTSEVGFAYRDVAYVSLESWLDSRETDEIVDLQRRLADAVAVLPGVVSVSYTDQEPLGDDSAGIAIRLPGDGASDPRMAQLESVGADYFALLELPITRGRAFTVAETANRGTEHRPAIVSETTARNLWPSGDPLGATLVWGDVTLEVVGVVADAEVSAPGRIDPLYIYLPASGGSVLLVKHRIGFDAVAAAITGIIRGLDPTLVASVMPLEASLGWWRGLSGVVTTLGSALGVLALVLAAVGIYGVVAYAVTRRYRELGIRMALGARTRDVLHLVLWQTLRPVAVGAVIGIAAASAMARVLSSVLFGVSPADPIGFSGAALVVLGVALAAGLLAARAALRGDPTDTLRHD